MTWVLAKHAFCLTTCWLDTLCKTNSLENVRRRSARLCACACCQVQRWCARSGPPAGQLTMTRASSRVWSLVHAPWKLLQEHAKSIDQIDLIALSNRLAATNMW